MAAPIENNTGSLLNTIRVHNKEALKTGLKFECISRSATLEKIEPIIGIFEEHINAAMTTYNSLPVFAKTLNTHLMSECNKMNSHFLPKMRAQIVALKNPPISLKDIGDSKEAAK